MFCCAGLAGLIESAGDRGIAALVYKTSNGFRFSIQSRAVSIEHQDWVLSLKPPLPGTFNVSCNIGMRYCPFCGTKLETLINSKNKKSFEELAEKHRQIDNAPY
jgi:hypothetical protein